MTIESELHKRVISRRGTPRILHSDNDAELANKILRESTKKFDIRHTETPKCYSEINPTGRYNGKIKQIVKIYIENDHSTWEEHIDNLQFAIETNKYSLT